MSSEITKCYIDIDSHEWAECGEMISDEIRIYEYCLKQGAKNNMGFFIEGRCDIAKKLKVGEDVAYLFFEKKFPNLIGFCPDTHLMWAKTFYARIELGLTNQVWKYEMGKDGVTSKTKQMHVLTNKNNFIKKLNNTLKAPITSKSGDFFFLKDHWMMKEWVKRNRPFLEPINEDVKSVNGNNYNLDFILSLA